MLGMADATQGTEAMKNDGWSLSSSSVNTVHASL